jgi:hypothetical protein
MKHFTHQFSHLKLKIMKKSTLLILLMALMLPFSLSAQSLLYEDFSSGTFPPADWSLVGDGLDHWSADATNDAGGEAPEAKLFWTPAFEGNSRLVTKTIATSGLTEVVLTMRNILDDYFGDSTPFQISIETTSDGGTTWHEVWLHVSDDVSIGPDELFVLISNEDVGSDNFQIAFVFDGNTNGMTYWKFDNVDVSAPTGLDAAAIEIILPGIMISDYTVAPKGVVSNAGAQSISFDVKFDLLEDGTTSVYNETVTITNLAPSESIEVTFPEWTTVAGNYTAVLTTLLAADAVPENDEISTEILVSADLVELKPLYEEFTSSTCGPCAWWNAQIDPILAENAGTHSLIKYQMNWPEPPGDPYYTAEGGVRKDYYNVTVVPDYYINSEQNLPWEFSQDVYDSYQGAPTAMILDIETAEIDENYNINITLNIDVIEDYAAGLIAQIVVVEKKTTENIASNGELEFFNVMMKMLPDAYGTTLPALVSGTTETITATYDMSQTNMEGANDLAVIVFVQNNDTKEVFQSEEANVASDSFDEYNVTFNITDSEGGAVESAEIYLQGYGVEFSNTDGEVVYGAVLPNSYAYEVKAAGLFPASGTVDVIDGNVVINVAMGVPSYYFYEDFATEIPADWTSYVSGSDWLYWADEKVIFFKQTSGDNLIMLVSPLIDIDPAKMLYFDAGENDIDVIISFGYMTDASDVETFVELNTYTSQTEVQTFEYDLESYDFPQNNVYFAWKYSYSELTTWFTFDNVIITAGPTGIDENLAKLTAVYPNPANDVVNIASAYTIENVNVFNANGQVITNKIVNSNNYKFNTSEFKSGLYLFQIQTVEGMISKRVVIE